MVRMNLYSVKLVKEQGGIYNVPDRTVRTPRDAERIVQTVLDLNSEAVEKFGILTLNTKNQVVGIHVLHIGGVNSSVVDRRTVFQNAILNNATSIVLFHNHPSGDPEPSREDINLTNIIAQAGDIMGIEVLDHIITGDGRFVSMKEKGLF
jgi:DNA repair protein RadC